MQIIEIAEGPLTGLRGEAVYFPNSEEFSVSIPSFRNSLYREILPKNSVKIIDSNAAPILEKKEFVNLHTKKDEVQIIGCKGSCGSVWCPECYTRKGGSKRFSERLKQMHWRAVRQVVLTVDLKKFGGSGLLSYESIKEAEALSQFIHNLRRTAGIDVKDYCWILEWHTDGSPHWHLFVETEKGKAGMIGNKALLNHWKYGMVFESWVKSEDHWRRFTDYFGANGYFDPKSNITRECKDKSHQLRLPDWAMDVTYRIRKTDSMRKPKEKNDDELLEEERESGKAEMEPKTYRERLGACGQSTYCQIRRGTGYLIWRRFNIPYSKFKTYFGRYVQHVGYVVQMPLSEFFEFTKEYHNIDLPLVKQKA